MATLILPDGLGLPALIERVETERGGLAYANAVATACAYLDGKGRGDVESYLRKRFPNTWDSIEPTVVEALRAVAETKALVYEGTPRLLLTDAATKQPIEAASDGTLWADVMAEAGTVAALRRVDVRSVVPRLAFARVLWDEVDERLRIDVFDATHVYPLYDPDRPDLATVPVVALELAPMIGPDGKPIRRFEVWTAVLDDAGATVDASFCVCDEHGEILRGPEANPYRGPDGGAADQSGYPVIPIVAFGELAQTPWPWPLQSVIDGQRTLSAELANANHCAILQSHGQWVARQIDQNADSWTGGARETVPGTSRRLRGEVTTAANIAFGPDVVPRAPYGWALDHVTQGAQLTAIWQGLESRLRQFCVMNGIPPGVLVDSARAVSGVALLVEREPLERYRRDRIALFERPTRRFIDLCRIVWNTHHEPSQRFTSPGGVRADVHFDRTRPVMEPIASADLAIRLAQTGLYSDAERLAKVEGVSVAEAQARLDASRAERGAAQEQRGGLVSRLFASPLAQARGAQPDVEDDEDDTGAD